MKHLFRRIRRSNRPSIFDQLASSFRQSVRRQAGGRRFEPLESRLLLHNGPHAADPDYDFNSNFSIEADFSIYVDSQPVAIPVGAGSGIEAINGNGKVEFAPGPQSDFVTVGDFFASWAADPVAGSPRNCAARCRPDRGSSSRSS